MPRTIDLPIDAYTRTIFPDYKGYVYLAGSTQSNWRDSVKACRDDVRYFDPISLNDGREPEEYSPGEVKTIAILERRGLIRSNIIFCYVDYAGTRYGTVAELAFASAFPEKILIVCNEKRVLSLTDWMEAFTGADFYTDSFDEALEFFKNLPM